MGVLMAGALMNVILDPVFIYGLDLGVAGAAGATAVSQSASTLIYLGYIFRKKSIFSFHIKECRFTRAIMSEILKIGIPTLIFQLLTSLSITMVNGAAKAYGDSALAAMGPVTKIMSVGSLMVFGFIKGLQPIAGYSWGAKRYGRLREAGRTSVIWSTAFCTVFGLAAAICSSHVIAQFTKNDLEMIRIGTAALRANGVSFLFFGFYTVYSSLFLAMGKAKEGCLLGACRQGLCFVPPILILPALWGLQGILYAQPAADIVSAAAALYMAIRLHKELESAMP